jgi:glyoxylase-like metal-dependent hydrolase (beta-lactamase superfamily II)
MELQQISDHCFAVLNEKNRVCDANSGFINLGEGVVIDTQSDLPHAQQMIDLFGTVWSGMPRYVVLTHEDLDHVAGNQLFPNAEIIAHRTVPDRMTHTADPSESQKLQHAIEDPATCTMLENAHPGVLAVARQLRESFDFDGIKVVLPTMVFDDRHVLNLGGTDAHLIYVGPSHQAGDVIVHVPGEGVLFTGDVLFNQVTPMAWLGTYQKFFDTLDLIIDLEPATIVPGHGPVCGVDEVRQEQAYFHHVFDESRKYFEAGLAPAEAAERIDLGRYGGWKAPTRLVINVERAYRELRNEPTDAPWELPKIFDGMYHLAKTKGLALEF